MSPQAQLIADQINTFIRTYIPDYGTNLNLNRILLLIIQFIDGVSGGGGSGGSTALVKVTSLNFINATDCPITAFANTNIAIYWVEGLKFLDSAKNEFAALPGGGFSVTIPGFDSTAENFTFYVFKIQDA